MSRPKPGPALFELMGSEGPRATERLTPSAIRPGRSPGGVEHGNASTSAKDHLASGWNAAPPGSLRLVAGERDRDRVLLTLSVRMGAVGGLVLLTCLAASFLAGRYFGERSGFHDGLIQAGHAKLLNLHGSNDLTTIRARPPETNLIKPLLVKAEADSGGAPARMISTLSSAPPPSESSAEKTIAPIVEWVPGLTYIVAQEFAADCGDEPTKAQAFLGQSGVSTQPVRMRNGSVQLITVQGFNHKVPEQKRQSEDLLRKIQSLGAEYYAKGGGYRLKGYFKTHKTESR